MKVVVMAGGAGSRLRPLTIHRPKPMVPIINKPVMSHILDLVKRHGATEVIITVQYLADFIQKFFGDGSNLGLKIHYSIEDTPLGTAGSVKNAQKYLDDTFVVISGDALTNFNLTKVIEYHKKNKSMTTLALYRVDDPVDYGVTILNDKGHIVRFQEKPSRGSVMSDYVNTGIYVLEPDVLDYFDTNIPFDFSNDLFPLLQEKGHKLYGYVCEGYWCDIGNISEYMRATSDVLKGDVQGVDYGRRIRDEIWVGRDVDIAPDAHIEGPVYLGNSVQVRSGVVIRGPTVIRDYSVIDHEAVVERSIFWRNCYVGERVHISGAILLRQASVKPRATIFEGVVVGDGTIVGSGAILNPNVRIWPNKEIEPRATVNSSIIWGSQGRRDLFTHNGVRGMVNVDLTPEFSAKLGAAFGGTLPKGAIVTINRDIHRSSRMIKRAIISGLPSAGVNVWDLESQPIPVARYYTGICEAVGGVHVCLSPVDQRVVDIHFMDSKGQDLGEKRRRNVESVFFREDFRRVYLDDTGTIEYAQQVSDRYKADFLTHLNTKAIRERAFKIVIDFANAPTANVLPSILDALNCNVIALNANIDDSKAILRKTEFHTSLRQMQLIASALETQIGVLLGPGGEKLFITDNRGYMLEGITACAVMTELALRDVPGSTVAVPVDLPNLFEQIAERHNGRVIRTELDQGALIKAARSNNAIVAGNGRGNFIFPDFQHAFDGLMALAKLLEFLATQKVSLSDVVSNLPVYHISRREVPCAWEAKATVMRLINERFQNHKNQILNGLKINLGGNKWVLIMPDPTQPYFRITTEATSREEVESLADEYTQMIQKIAPLH
ncbi:sugar phosphate nucleotidyltransferase [Anaerolineales bacterium HSG6]|nr:sugar phosphate nucleotidyltransferase [Anaerolineales bacterium HSG6]